MPLVAVHTPTPPPAPAADALRLLRHLRGLLEDAEREAADAEYDPDDPDPEAQTWCDFRSRYTAIPLDAGDRALLLCDLDDTIAALDAALDGAAP